MIAAAFLVLLRPYSIQCVLFLLLLLLGTIATILFFCCWHRRLQKARHPIKSVFSGRSRSRDAVMRTHHFRSEVIYLARNFKGFRSSPRHARRRVAARLEETQPIVEAHHLSEQETSVRKRKIKKSSRVQPEFYHSVQVTPTRKPSSGSASYRGPMSSSADLSDEEDFSQRSGAVSPAPGDTLPWNLPKHQRSKRKIQGGSVLDPAERAVLRIADERDKVQKKTFTKWINQHLMKVRKHVNDLYEDLRDGHNLISLLEVLSGDTLPRERDFLKTLRLVSSTEACANEQHEDVEDEDKGPREKGRMRFHRLQNVQIALDYLKKRQVKLVNIRNDDITDGNPKLILGLIWTIILHFQISDIHVTGESEDMSAKERLLLWSQQTAEGYAGVCCENFTTCWRDGRLFNAIIHRYRPDLIDMNTVAVQSNLANLEHAFFVAEKLGVARLLDPEDVDVSSPDEKSVITYVSSLYDAFPKVPEGGEGISANDVEVKWVEYQNMVNYLMQWIRHHVTIMSDRTFPNNPVELKALYNQYLQFKETEIPPKETDKSKIKRLYKLLEVWIEFGRIRLPQGYHPNDIEKEWGKLIIAMLEREKTLRPEVERLEMLQQIANRIQRDSRSCEDKLILARNALQADTKRLESGLQFQHEAEIAGYLLESENLLRQQVIDAQILIDGKYYQADQLVQRVAKLRDELMAIRTECSAVYNKGRVLTTEQTKLMISGITESLNSGFTRNLTPEINAAMTQLTPTLTSSSLTSGLSSGLASRLTPTITPAYTPGIPPRLTQSYVTGVDSGTLQTLKLMQIRKPLMKSAFVDQNLTEEEVNMKFVQDLLSWVEEMQVQLDRAEWGSDLPSVESHLENHKNVHKAIEEFESSLKEAKISEIQMTAPLKLSYAEKLHKLESQYSKLLNTSRSQERHLDTLHNFVSRATRELIWLNEKEEEEVAYDWSERNPNITRKKEYHAELMRELDQKEEVIKSVQEIAEQLLLENHPARLTIEAYRAAMQTQWSWILQLCHCVEQHLRENAAYFEFFSDAKEAMEYLKNLKDTIYRKYSCDRSSSLHRLEDLVQESMEEKEQLLQYKSTVAGLVGRAKAIIQLKPRNSDCILKASIPIKAICDYRQIEITIYKDDECVLANNSHRAKWKVISPSGNEAMVPSVCFTVPPPNKEAIDTANRIEQQFQNVLALWHESHVNMKSVVSWHYLTNEIEAVRAGNVASIKTMLPGEHQQVLSNLQSRFDDFVEDSQESKIFTSSDTAQLEREVNVCKQYYQELLKSAEREEQEESIYNLYISEVRNIRLQLESCEERLIRQIRTPVERDDVHENLLRIRQQATLKEELDRLKDDLGVITDKCEEFFSQAAGSPSVPTLRSELNVVIQNMNQVYSMSSIYIDKLETVNLVLKSIQEAETLVKMYETKLCTEEAVTADKNHIGNLMGTLKQWRSEVDEKRQAFHALEDELQKAKMISDQMFKMHKERDLDFDWRKEKVDQLAERWQNIHSQIENRLRDLESINKSLKYYKDTYNSLDTWIQQVEDTQRKIQEIRPENSKALAKQLNQHKMLVSEIEMKQSKIDECQKYSEQYSAAVKDYELQTMTYRAMVDSQQKSPVKRQRMQSSSDFIIQEFMDLRTRYTALVTSMIQYIKFAGDSLKRLEEEEKSVEEEKKEHVEKAGDLLKWVSNLSKTLSKEEGEKAEKTDLPKQQISLDEMSTKKEQIAEALQTTQSFLAKHGDKMTDEERNEMERQVRSLQESYSLLSNEALKQLQEAQYLSDEKMEEKDVAERQQECKEKLQEICDLLTQTENRLIGQQESLVIGDSKAELEQYQTKQEEIQKDMRMSAQALAEVVKNTETFLKENGEKLSREDKTILEQKLNEAKTKCLLLSQKAEESKKELDKAMTTAIKQETEKVAAIEQLEESKNTIENLLDWLSNVDKEAEHGRKFKQVIEQNGTHFEEGDVKALEGEEDDVNGNLLEIQQDIETQMDGLVKSTEDNLNQQYQKVKAQHEKIISQQQAVIIATQSAQALLEKQGHYLSPEEKEKMQRNMKELKAQYETALAESERKMKLTHSLREELEKFDADYSEFETWLQQAEQELDNLEAGASDFSGIMVKLKRQKSFSEDVISHKGDLRYITISGQRVLDAARSCSKRDGVKVDKDGIDTSATYTEVQNKLDSASDRFKSLYTKCSILGNNLKDLVDKYRHYEDASSGLLSGLQASEIAVNKQLSEPIAVDPKNLQRQLEETKVLQGQVSNHQIAVEKLKKAAEVLLDTRGELTPDKDEIQKTLDDIVERYDNLSKSVNERNEKLQITLTRSLSVQDGLDEMLDWMEGVEKSLEEQDQVPLNSAALQDIISKSIMLEQDIVGRQSSMNTMNEKVKKFMETADPSTASTLQAKMSELAGRFSEASNKHKEKLMKMEELKTKVGLFEDLSEKLQSFLDEKNQALSETEAPRKDVSEVSQYMQEASVEMAQHKKDLEVLQQLLEELSFHALPGDKALVLEKVNTLSKKFREVEETVKEKEEDVSSCQKQMDAFELLVESLKKWIKETTERIPAAQPSLNTEELKKPLEDTLNLRDEWTLKSPELQKMNSRGTLLCSLITAVTSPAKLRAVAKSGGTVLNGEGGAPGTQDFLKNKELTTVQQAMSDVNHSYEDLGVLLKEKISELESMLSKMQNIQEESTSMMQWLQKMDKTASDWEAAPTDSEAVKAQVEQHKLFENELKQSANKVQELKDKVTELLEKNPDSPEAPKWRQMLDKIDSKWKELNQVTSERQQKLEESSNYLTQFQTAEAQLKHWLIEKELMVSVLGPLSIDPNMLNTQKQQVQILLKEFDTRKPQYEQLAMAGEGILKRPGEHPPSHEVVKEQLAAVAQKWDSLTGQLRNRCDRIDQAIVKSTEYQSLLRSLSDKLSALDSKLSSSLAVSAQPDTVKQQLEIAREMKEEIEQEVKNINAARALCEELSALVGEEYLKAELTRQLDGILKSFKDIEQKSDNHVQQLQSAYATSHQFQQMSKDFQAWLGKKKEELNQARPVSAKLDALQSLIEEQKDFEKTLTDQMSSYERIVAEGESILQKTQGADKAALQSQMAMLRSNWDEMNKQVKGRQDKLTDCLEKALKYKQHVENLQPWIEKCQSNLCELKIGINPVETENSIVQVRAWQKDLDKHHGLVELLNNTAESLLSASQTDKEIIQEETKVLNQKVNVVTEQLQKKRECLENMAQRLKEFQESSRETEKQLKSAKEHLESHDSLGPQSFSNKHLTMMQAQQKALQALKPHVDLAKKLAQDLVVEASDSEGVSDLLLQAESLEREYTAVNQQVEERCSFLEARLQGIGHFQNSIREMFSQFAEFDDELDSMAPVGRDLKVLQAQREDMKCFLKKLEDLIMNNENANRNCKMMLATEAEASPDLVGIKRDLEALNKQCNKLLDRAKAREDQVEGTISRVEEFYSELKEFSSLLGRAEKHEESQGPVGMETETINQQLNTFKVFQKEEIEPLQVKQQEVNWLGQGLIQSAAKSTNTENLEHDLEDVNTRWKTLNKKVAQRAAQLQEALLHCGRFQDALESLLSWLIDTEDLVANQKPPSAEFKVVKAQIQEQKLLQRLLDDRKPTVEVIKREGEKIAESAEPADRVKILKQLSFLDSRWDALLSKAETRNRQLEGILVVAQQFHEALEPLVEWLSTTEKRLANAEPIGTQASKLQQQISQHKALEDDVLAHNKGLHQAISIGESLKAMSSREDKDMVQEKLDSSQARYIEIQEKSNSRSELLQQAYSNAQIFGEDEVELMNWLNEVHDKLSKLSVQDCHTELLEKQHSELLDLQEEILLRKQNVDLAIQNGLELLKQTTGDEVVIIQDKLEGIKTRYKDITKLSSDVSRTLEQALQLARQLHSTHEELCKWLDEVEVELISYEAQIPKGEELSQVQERQKELNKEVKNNKGLLDSLNEVGSAFLELVPWRAREGLDKMITEDNERYRLVSDMISQKVDEIDAAILRSQQFDQAADAEFAWIAETEKKLMSLGDIRLERDQTTAQLQVQKAFTMEILRHKDTIDELVKSGDKIMNTCTEEEKQTMKKKMESLVQKYDAVCQMNSERNLQLERAQSLVNQFWETYEELWPWLTETEMIISQLPAPALEYETLKQQQEEHRQLRELIAEHKPHIDKMNKTAPQLLELSPGEGFFIQEKYVAADTLYSKIKEDVKKRALALDEAISQCTQFHDKIDPTLESLKRIVERLRQPPSISAEVEKIKEQISENKNVSVDLEKLQPVYETLKQRGEEMIARSEGADKDISAKVVQDKLDQMVLVWEDIQTLTEEREAKLLDVMELAEKFWCDHMALVTTIKDTQDFIRELEGPGVDPSVVKQQQEAAEAAKEEIDGLQEELETVVSLGSELRAACGEPDKPIVNKSIDELNSAWDVLNKTWKERVDKLVEAMQAAVQYQDGLQAIFDWVDIAGSKLASMSPVGTDLETVKQQTEELKQFKTEAYQQQIEMERLNHQAELLLKKVTAESDKHTVQDPLSELKLMWDSLEEKIVNRQHKLEGALLALGQFQHALGELLTWLTHTEDLLNEQKPVGGDPKAIEIELAKHHVLQNDVLAHQSTVEAVKKAGNDLIESSAVEEASNLRSKLELLNQRWQNVLEKTEQRKQQLDSALIQAQGFHGEVEDMQQWLTDTERQLLASKPVGGLPETAREQLNTHMELCAAFEAKEETYKRLMQKGQQMLARCPESAETNVEQDINNLKEKWESVQTKLSERKTKLEEALNLAMEFHNSLQDFINWLTQAEQTLTAASRPSLILDTVLFQIDEHKVFATEVNSHRDQIIELDKTGTHLKYFSQKQDVVLIKNLLISVQSRWEKVVQRLVERGRALDDARKRAKQFHEAWHKLMEWLEESEKSLDSDLEIANDPDKIKMQLAQHKEFQKSLGAKHSVYDTTNRTGRSLKEKTTLADDNLKLDDMLSELRDKWDTICGKSVERQNKLEEALLFSGQFTDALQALIDWLYKIEPQLAEDQPVHGDIDLVMNLIDNHKVFQKELGKRTSSVQALKRSARELIEGSRDDSSWVKVQMQELSTRWETVCALSVSKQTRLEQALRQAEEFHSVVHVLLEWLAEAEQALRFHGVLPDDEEALRTLIDQHREFMKKLEEKKAELNKATSMGEAILAICHPDSITTIKHWITIIRARFEEVLAWAKQHQQRLAGALAGLIANQELLEALLSWLQWAETTLTEKDKEVIPQEIEEVKALIAEHQAFMEEMTRKQPDVDKVTKTYKRKALEPTPVQSHIPVLDKGRAGRKRSPTPGIYPSAAQAQIETKNPRVNLLVSKWQQVWLLALERRRKLNDALDRLEELREFANFDFDIWRKKYMRWMNHKKSRVMDFFRRIDKDQDGKITRQEFIDGILSSKFPTSRLEMSAVADIFDRDGDGYIDYYEFVAALHPNKDAYKPLTDADKIEDEVTRQVAKCKCAKRFQVEQIGDNKYRFFLGNQFGDSQQLRLVRILRSTVMVRVGGGWMALDEFLVKNDPCRAKGRTNVELREKFILADGASQSMAAFRPRGRRSRPSSRGASPNRSTSLSSQAGQAAAPQAVATSTPKTPHHLTRNYGKPWLTNSKTSTPSKPPESSDYQGSSAEGTPIQGSKLRLPGYLSGKGFHSGEDSGILSTAATRVRAQFAETRRTPSRPGSRAGSKAGSRSSSRRGSDASDFDISEIQSVCSDMSETVPATSRPTPRAGSRPGSAKPSKIPTPQRRPLASKSDRSLKR
ncbi:dystonin isoform X7 [Opisthocomus hoazin]|uniref:dystonin isoform X7 n=1 Tax=Opisthocomus hoazin TaxID=30419 RepID=UPI003F533A6D